MAEMWQISVERRREILGALLLGITILLFLALVTDGYRGEVSRTLDNMSDVPNALGRVGAFIASILTLLLGHASHVTYCITCVWGIMLLRHAPLDRLLTRLAGFVLVAASIAALFDVDANNGGAIGRFFGGLIHPRFGLIGGNVIAVTLALVGVLLSTDFLFVRALNTLRILVVLVLQAVAEGVENLKAWRRTHRDVDSEEEEEPRVTRKAKARPTQPRPSVWTDREDKPEQEAKPAQREIRILPSPVDKAPEDELPFDDVPEIDDPQIIEASAPEEGKTPPSDAAAPLDAGANQQELDLSQAAAGLESEPEPPKAKAKKPRLPRRKTAMDDELPPDYVYPKRYTRPPIDLFEPAPEKPTSNYKESLYKISEVLEETLLTFGIEARVTDVTRGPTITRFELEPAPGIKVSRFLALADDLALALKAHRVRVEAPIPGKGRVGIEVPNKEREMVVIRELLESRAFRRSKHQLALALGKGIGGEVDAADLATMPHLLVAGATGAGKTVCVKTMLASLLTAKTPDELQLILIDPKMVELSIFNDIPHLITPVVTDPKKASTALTWLISEMEERYRLFAHLRTRNIEVYNESVDNGEIEMPDGEGEEAQSVDVIRKLPYIVCIIDELADLMMLARAEVEDAIARLAQLARAVGIHLIIATQRPSVDVLTGVIKANFPTRISFQVSSRVDSRCILDEIGAERLIGQGDMLHLPAGRSKPTRIQGAFVSDEEMNRLIAYLKTQAPPQYRDEIERFGKSADDMADIEDQDDELFDDAVRVVLETGQASISMVQRRLRVGYTRAARLIDMMEMRGIVGPHIGSKAREILVDVQSNDEVA